MNDPKAGDKKTSTPAHSGFSVRMLEAEDIAALTPVLREHVRDLHSGQVVESEVNAIQSYMQGAADEFGRTRRYLVAFNAEGTAIGCMALAVPEERMAQHFAGITGAPGTTSVELLNAFVATAYLRGQGIGRMLLEAICRMGAADGAHTLLINSGPRYRHSWAFYDRVCDSSHGFIDDYYGEGRHAKTWLKDLRTFA
ncbi:GNAT family N-acetyltransferase [Herbaspirillum rhizosphaerae]|uniref:GNAT family N-acetyltransferase n=1 Tax=Herbaspirillum rhizosphaerae TaxID=346179 RepID=A0ABW8Z4G2_9BURK